MFHDILVAVDGSATAERALTEAIDLAQAYRAHLTIVYVVPPPPTPSIGAPIDAERLKRDVEQEGDEILTSAVERVPDDVSVASRTRHGHPSGEILRQLEEEGHDLVVLGSRGRGRARANLLGSVAREVHYGTRVAMLVIHPDEGDA